MFTITVTAPDGPHTGHAERFLKALLCAEILCGYHSQTEATVTDGDRVWKVTTEPITSWEPVT